MTEQRANEDATRLAALREAAEIGWNYLEVGRYVDIATEDLEGFIQHLGKMVADILKYQE